MAQLNNVLPFTARGKQEAPHVRSESTVLECRNVVGGTLPKLVKGLFQELDDTFNGLANTSENVELRTPYVDPLHSVRQRGEQLQKRFIDGVLGDFDRLWIQGPQNLSPQSLTSGPTETGLSLMDNEELEFSLAVNNIISKGENRFHGELYALTSRFAHLAGDIELGIHSNPLGPAAICNRFDLAFRSLPVETRVLLVIYKLFDKQVMRHLGGLYEKVNTLLARAGILPKLAFRPDHELGRSTSAPGGNGHLSGGATMQDKLFPTLQGLLAGYRLRHEQEHANWVAEQLPAVATQELLGALSVLQRLSRRLPDSGTGVPKVVDLGKRLSNELSLEEDDGPANRALGKVDRDVLDVIAMLFEFSLEDPNLPDAMKALISRLQIPMVKVAILDKTFFSHKHHPARCLLNNLARAAMGWSEDSDRSESSLYGRIESVVDRLVANFEEDVSLFKELDDEFSAYMEKEERRAKIVEERTNQVIQGKEQLRVAKQVAEAEINARLGGHAHVPLVARALLEDGWKDVLVLTYLRQGPESKAWADKLEVIDRLLWSVKPKVEHNQRRDLLRMIPDLQRSLRDGLDSISYDRHKMTHFFSELQTCHTAALRGVEGPDVAASCHGPTASPPVRKETPRIGMADMGSSMPAADAGASMRQDKSFEMAKNLAGGAWLELREENGKQSRIKLSWKSDVYDHYLFVNRRGAKVMDLTAADLARLFRNGHATILEHADTPFTDRALDCMLETLKNTGDGRA